METEFYHCKYCFKQFEPTRRRVQKFCSNTCRSKNHHAKNLKSKIPATINQNELLPSKAKIDTMSLAGMGNATAGSLAADGIKALLTPNDSKPATKGDLKKLVSEINGRYHLVKNIEPRFDGALPYFDFDTNEVVYMHMTQSIQ